MQPAKATALIATLLWLVVATGAAILAWIAAPLLAPTTFLAEFPILSNLLAVFAVLSLMHWLLMKRRKSH
jgi:hypothetical protein